MLYGNIMDAPQTTAALADIFANVVVRVQLLQQQQFKMMTVEERSELMRMLAQNQPLRKITELPVMQRLKIHEIMHSKPNYFIDPRVYEDIMMETEHSKVVARTLVTASTPVIQLMDPNSSNSTDEQIIRKEIHHVLSTYYETNQRYKIYNTEHFDFYNINVEDDAKMAAFYRVGYAETIKRNILIVLVSALAVDTGNWLKQVCKLGFCLKQSGLATYAYHILFDKDNLDVIFSPSGNAIWNKFFASYTSVTIVDAIFKFKYIEDIVNLGMSTMMQMTYDFALHFISNYLGTTRFASITNFLPDLFQKGFNILLCGINFDNVSKNLLNIFTLVNAFFGYVKSHIKQKFDEKAFSKEMYDALLNLIKNLQSLVDVLRINVCGIILPSDSISLAEKTRLERASKRKLKAFAFNTQLIFGLTLVGNQFNVFKQFLGQMFFAKRGQTVQQLQTDMMKTHETQMSEEEKNECVALGFGKKLDDGNFKFNHIGINAYTTRQNIKIDDNDLSIGGTKLTKDEMTFYQQQGMLEYNKNNDKKWSITQKANDVLFHGTNNILSNEKQYQNMSVQEVGYEVFTEFLNQFPELALKTYVTYLETISSVFHIFLAMLSPRWRTPKMLCFYGVVVLFLNRLYYSQQHYAKTISNTWISKKEVARRKKELEQNVTVADAEKIVKSTAKDMFDVGKQAHDESRSNTQRFLGGLGTYWNMLAPSSLQADTSDPDSYFFTNEYTYSADDVNQKLKEAFEEYTHEKGFSRDQAKTLLADLQLWNSTNTSQEVSSASGGGGGSGRPTHMFTSPRAKELLHQFKYKKEYANLNIADTTFLEDMQNSWNERDMESIGMQVALHLFMMAMTYCTRPCVSNIGKFSKDYPALKSKCTGYGYTLSRQMQGHMVSLGCSTALDPKYEDSDRVSHFICPACIDILNIVTKRSESVLSAEISSEIKIPGLLTKNEFLQTSVMIRCMQCTNFTDLTQKRKEWIEQTIEKNPKVKANHFTILTLQWRTLTEVSERETPTSAMSRSAVVWQPSIFAMIAIDPPAAFIPYRLLEMSKKIEEINNPFIFLLAWLQMFQALGFEVTQLKDSLQYEKWDKKFFFLVKEMILYFNSQSDKKRQITQDSIATHLQRQYTAHLFEKGRNIKDLKIKVAKLVKSVLTKYPQFIAFMKRSRKLKTS